MKKFILFLVLTSSLLCNVQSSFEDSKIVLKYAGLTASKLIHPLAVGFTVKKTIGLFNSDREIRDVIIQGIIATVLVHKTFKKIETVLINDLNKQNNDNDETTKKTVYLLGGNVAALGAVVVAANYFWKSIH